MLVCMRAETDDSFPAAPAAPAAADLLAWCFGREVGAGVRGTTIARIVRVADVALAVVVVVRAHVAACAAAGWTGIARETSDALLTAG
jgi:hypothetical protein